MANQLRNVLIAIGLFLPATVHATWYSENIEDGADIIMMDLRWPWWPSGSYFANWNTSFNPKPNNISFYAGFTSYVPDGPGQTPQPDQDKQNSFRPGSVWSFWGSNAQGTPVRFTDVAPNLFIKNNYGGEGSSGTLGGVVWPFVERNRWYTMVARVWRPLNGDEAYVGRWIKDQSSNQWHLIGIAKLPIPATSFTGNSGFLEPLTSEKAVRSLHRRLGYFRKDGHWRMSNKLSIDKTQYVVLNTVPERDHEYVAIEYAQRPDLLPQQLRGEPISGDVKHTFTVRQPALPTFDKPSLQNVRAIVAENEIAVSWEIPPTATPALSFKVELFDNPQCTGAPRVVREIRNPSLRQMLIATPVPGVTVRLSSIDIFDQESARVIVNAEHANLRPASTEFTRTRPGLKYELYVQDEQRIQNYFNPPQQVPDERHYWLTLDEIDQGKRIREGISRGFDIGVREDRNHGYAIRFSGLLDVPKSGAYLFYAQIDGAYRMELDDKELLVWDGQHGTTERVASAMLQKGLHRVAVTYLYDELPANNFHLDWESTEFTRKPISIDSLQLEDAGEYPQPHIDAVSKDDGTGIVTVSIDSNDQTLGRTSLYLGQLKLVEGMGEKLEYAGALPAGRNRFWTRTVFNEKQTVDSEPIYLEVKGRPVSPEWTLRNVGDAKAEAGLWQTGKDGFQFFGNGMHTVTQKAKGNFHIQCRIDNYNGANGEPVNRRAWIGLTAREHGERLNWEWGRDFHVVQTARDGLRSSADYTDFGGERISSYELPKNHPWIRIARKGDIWTAWTSQDGTHWELGAYQYKRMQDELDVGLFVNALPQDAEAHYHATVSHLSLHRGDDNAIDLPTPIAVPPNHTDGDRITGVVIAQSNPLVVVVRTNHRGLYRSTDGGQTWRSANGNLSGDDLSVRSVAIDPLNPERMLCGTGVGTNGSLWKSTDGGSSWNRQNVEVDFDGQGPSALCGEVIAFDLRHADTIYVGSESKGFFKSNDGGNTWLHLGCKGERITSVVVWPWEKHYPAPAKGKTHLCFTTCPDNWMSILGRGPVTVKTSSTTTRAYTSNDDVQSLRIADERADTGFFNVAFDKAMQSVNEMRYATSHGYQTQVFESVQMALYPPQKQVEWLRPFTAVAAAAQGDQKFGRFLTQAVAPETLGRYSISERWAFEWSWLEQQGDVPSGGLIAAACDMKLGQIWYFVHTDGLYRSNDGGRTLTKVLNADATNP